MEWSNEALKTHMLTHILYNEDEAITSLSFKFTEVIAPSKGSYEDEPEKSERLPTHL